MVFKIDAVLTAHLLRDCKVESHEFIINEANISNELTILLVFYISWNNLIVVRNLANVTIKTVDNAISIKIQNP